MGHFKVTRPARADLKSIGTYTFKEWGVVQLRKYLSQLESRFQDLADNPKKGRLRPELAPELRSHRQGKHVIFYREAGDPIEIVRILHDRMDFIRIFRPTR